MLRTQVYLPEELSQELKLLAKKEEKPTAELIRELLSKALKQRKRKRKRNAGDTLMEIAKINARGPDDLSTNLFDYLYGEKSDYAKKNK